MSSALKPESKLTSRSQKNWYTSQLRSLYINCLQKHGEVSLVFFDNRFSHAVRKRPGAGDWRVQEEHGGSERTNLLKRQPFHAHEHDHGGR